MNGVRVVRKALASFEKATVALEKGVELCKGEIESKETAIARIEDEKKSLVETQKRGERVIVKIKELIS